MKGITIKAIKLMLSVLILGMLAASGAAQGGYDWLNPGGVIYSYNGWNNYPYTYPNFYYSYPSYYPTYTYPTYYYTTPAVYPTYYYNPVAYNYYDPWWATNVYGWTGATYYSSSGWTWSSPHGGFFF